jgi:LysM repeat protein
MVSEEEKMSKKVIIGISLVIAASFLFAACERSASQPNKATPTNAGTATNAAASPEPTGMSLMQAWGTSTANYELTEVAMGLITAAPTSENPQITPTPQGTLSTTVVPPTGAATSTPVPGTTPVVVVATATPGRPATYTLQAGEFPYCLARRFDVNPADLLSLNGLGNAQTLQPGISLRIPQSGSFPGIRALHSHPAQFTVNVNDTFYSIACYFGDVDPTSIAAANGLSLSSPLTTGKILNIP